MLLTHHATMNKLRAKYQASKQRRRAKFIKSWALRRAKGKKRFLAQFTIVMTVVWVAVQFLKPQNWNKAFDELPLNAIIYLVLSLICAAIAWRENERAYRRYLSTQPNDESNRPASTREA
jgi:protein-S-isoprenylcysteine O-methyltransferase Ste14